MNRIVLIADAALTLLVVSLPGVIAVLLMKSGGLL